MTLKRLTDMRLVERLERRVGGARSGSDGYLYTLGPAGQQLLHRLGTDGRRRKPYEPGAPYVQHRLMVSELFVQLTEAERVGKLRIEQFDAEPDSWRFFIGPHGERASLKPDAFVRIDRGRFEDVFFVECDRATESGPAVERTFRRYRAAWMAGQEQARWGVFPRVVFLTTTVKRVRQLIDIAAAQPAESWELFTVRLFDDLLSVFAEEES